MKESSKKIHHVPFLITKYISKLRYDLWKEILNKCIFLNSHAYISREYGNIFWPFT